MSSPETPPNPKEKFSKKLTEMGGLGKKMADKAAPAMKIMAAVSKKALAIKDLSVGEMLVEYGILTKAKYAQVMESVTERHSFSQMVVEKGFAKEKDVLSAINKYYRLKLTKIDESTAHAIQNRPRTFLEKAITARLPIKVKLSLAIVATMVVSIFILSYTILQHQKTQLYKETVKTGRVSLTYFTSNARVHLLNDNILQLNVLINEAKSTEGLLFATIVDRNGIIKADTNTKLIGKKYKKPANAEGLVEEENSSYFTFTNSDGREVLNLSAPVTFNQKYLGDIQVGISLDFIEEQISKEKLFILMMSLGIILLAVGVAVYLGIGFSRPISELVTATHEISEGNLHFRVHIAQNDELGDLGKAFNIMAGDLHKKALMEKSFGSYVSPEILEMILDNPENPWVKGTRNQASVVFTDVRGFTAFSEVTEPEVVVESLNEYFSIGTDVVLEYNGYIDKFIGDAILAVFGVPVSQEDHAMRAVKASFEMQERLMDAAKKKGIELLAKIGIGINSGVVVAGNIGSTKKMEYTVIGDTVNTASRLNGLAGNGEVVISKDTLDRLGGKVKVEALPPAKVKGKTELIEVFKVLKI